MSLQTVTSSTHALGPKVWWHGECLHARTSLALRVIALGTVYKEVVVDPVHREIVVRTRTAWFFAAEIVIPFDAISHISYRYADLVTSWSIFGQAQDSVESYSVTLVLHDRDEVDLFSFAGSGSRNTGFVGVVMGDDLVDVEGDQQGQSLGYVDALMEITGKGLSKFSKPHKYKRT